MIKTISKIGKSQGITFDSALLQLARLKVGDEVNVEDHYHNARGFGSD
jgi:antitoxin component of MazEF toxin-antitoxin module